MGYKIGDLVRIKIEEQSNGYLRLIGRRDGIPPDESRCFYKEVQICGIYKVTNKDFVVLNDFDPHGYMSFDINEFHRKGYDVSDKYLGLGGSYIHESHIWPKVKPEVISQLKMKDAGGCCCKLCKNYKQYASPNRDDGSFVCFKCRSTKRWLLKCKPSL